MIAASTQKPSKYLQGRGGMVHALVCTLGILLGFGHQPAIAQEPAVPWECSGYTGEAQTRCIHTLMELQQEKIAKLEEQMKAQESRLHDLQETIERQKHEFQREALTRNRRQGLWSPFGAPSYRYAPLTPPFGIYLGSPWRYPRWYRGYGVYDWGPYWGPPGLSFNFRFGKGHSHRHRHW